MRKYNIKKAAIPHVNFGSWRISGLFYGYPSCCVDAFARLEHFSKDTKDRPLMGTGFVPCETCATTKTEAQLVEEIESNRIHNVPFPYGTGDRRERAREINWVLNAAGTGETHPRLNERDLEAGRKAYESYTKNLALRKQARLDRRENWRQLPIKAQILLRKAKKRFGGLANKYHVVTMPFKLWDSFSTDVPLVSWRRGENQVIVADAGVFGFINDWFKAEEVDFAFPESVLPRSDGRSLLGIGPDGFPVYGEDGPTLDDLMKEWVKMCMEPTRLSNGFAEALRGRAHEIDSSMFGSPQAPGYFSELGDPANKGFGWDLLREHEVNNAKNFFGIGTSMKFTDQYGGKGVFADLKQDIDFNFEFPNKKPNMLFGPRQFASRIDEDHLKKMFFDNLDGATKEFFQQPFKLNIADLPAAMQAARAEMEAGVHDKLELVLTSPYLFEDPSEVIKQFSKHLITEEEAARLSASFGKHLDEVAAGVDGDNPPKRIVIDSLGGLPTEPTKKDD